MADIDSNQSEFLSQRFEHVELNRASIDNKEFDNCTFHQCDFSETLFNKCRFIECSFNDCNLSVAKFNYSRFTDVMFQQCKVIGIDWTTADWPRLALSAPLKFYKCILNDSSFMGLQMAELVLQECKAHFVDFRDGNFSEADFSYTDFTNSLFNKTNLRSADFSEASEYNIDIFLNELRGAKFSPYEAIRLLDSLEIELIE